MTRQTMLMALLCVAGGCTLFEPRDPQPPSQSGSNLPPPTTADVVISNLESSIITRDPRNYISCFTNPASNTRGFTFIPSPDLIAELQPWSYSKESDFIQDLTSKAQPNGASNLTLTQVGTPLISSDSVDYQYIYNLTFETTPGNNFTSHAHGRLEFKIGVEDNRTRWSIYYWADNQENPGDTTWSAFKRKFPG